MTMMPVKMRQGQAELGDLQLECGGVLRNARMGYTAWGELNASGGNAIILASYYSGTSLSYAPWVEDGASQIFDPERYFVLACDQLGAGRSSRPGDGTGYDAWPQVTCADSVKAARKLASQLGIRQAHLVGGWSMGGMQAYAWAALFPGFARTAFALCATPGCEPVNEVFLRSIRPMLDHAVHGDSPATRDAALRAFGAAYAGWAYSDELYADGTPAAAGYASIPELIDDWAADHAAMDAGDLLAQLDCWLATKAPATPASATTVLSMPCSTDRYFLASSTAAARLFAGSRTQVLQSELGHIAGRPGIRAAETAAIREAVASLLAVADDH